MTDTKNDVQMRSRCANSAALFDLSPDLLAAIFGAVMKVDTYREELNDADSVP